VTLDGNGTFDLSMITNIVSVNSFKHGAETGALTVLLPNLVDNGTFDLGSTAQDLRLDGNGTFDLTSVTDFALISDIISDASTGVISVLLPNLNENLSGTFFLDGGADVTFVYGTNVTDRRAFVELGSGNDTVTGGQGNDTITLGGGSDTVVLFDGFNDGAGNDNIFGFTAGGDDQLDVTALTDTGGGAVTADEVTSTSLNGGADTRLTFPNGERIRLYGVAFADMNEESELAAAGIPLRNQIEVSNTNDSGGGSLRAAIEFANANPTEDTITFDIPGTGPHVIARERYRGVWRARCTICCQWR